MIRRPPRSPLFPSTTLSRSLTRRMKQTLVGRVIATFGRHLLVRDADGEEVRARPFGRALTVVCGDEVRCRLDARHDEVHRSEEHTSELQSPCNLVCRLLLEK